MTADSPPWGKMAHDNEGRVEAEQSLAGHCRDVAAVFFALIHLPGFRSCLAALAGRINLDESTLARLSYLTCLHDCGKVNIGFQARRVRSAPIVGHVKPLTALFGDGAPPKLASAAWTAMDAERLMAWGHGTVAILDAMLSHHGYPWPRDGKTAPEVRHWQPIGGYDPIEELARLRQDAEQMFPLAFTAGPPLPDTPAFVHAVAGLAQLADWIASSDWRQSPTNEARDAWAAEWLVRIGLDPRPWRQALVLKDPRFDAVFGFPPRAVQRHAATAPGSLIVLESETGSGKTEAALWRFIRLFREGAVDGLFFALPTRTAAVQLFHRIETMVAHLWPDDRPPTVLAVPGYLDEEQRGTLPIAADDIDRIEDDGRAPPLWASEHPKRYFAATISVGTIDQALLATLRIKHAHLRGSALMRLMLVVDEVHASDSYMRRILESLLADHRAAGGHAMLLSATLGGEARTALLADAAMLPPSLEEAATIPYPLISSTSGACQPTESTGHVKSVAVTAAGMIDDAAAIAAEALRAARAGAKVLVVRNTVAGAVAVQRELTALAGDDAPELFRVEGIATLHHGRFATEDRRRLDAAVEAILGSPRTPGGYVVVGTQTLEQSLDIDADFLITDLAPSDVLLQRLGRLFRKLHERDGTPRQRPTAFTTPRATILVPATGLAPFLADQRPGGLSRHGLGHRLVNAVPQGVYPDLTVLEATLRLIAAEPVWQIPKMNRHLVEGAIHSQAIETLLASLPAGQQPEWRKHRNAIAGATRAATIFAALGVLRRDLPLMHSNNSINPKERISTRLGADSRLVTLPSGTIGPFGHPIRRLSVPEWMAADLDLSKIEVRLAGTGLELWVDGAGRFSYSAFGLSQIRG